MPTTSSIGTSGRTYATIQLWHDAFATGGWIGQCYNDSEFTVTTAISFSGKSTTGTNFITLQCATGQSFSDNASRQTNALAYNQANGVGVRRTTDYGSVISIAEDFVTISGLQIAHVGTQTNQSVIDMAGNQSNCVFEKLIIEGYLTGTSNLVSAPAGLFRNNLVVARSTGGAGSVGFSFAYAAGSPVVANCTIVRPSDLSGTSMAAFLSNSGGGKIINCAIFGFATLYANAPSGGSDYICSDLAVSFGTHNKASKTYGASNTGPQFKDTRDATRDFRVFNASSDLVGNGFTDTADIPAGDDIVGTVRT